MEYQPALDRKSLSVIFYQPYPAYGAVEQQFSLIIRGFNKIANCRSSLFCPLSRQVDELAGANKGKTVVRYPRFNNGLSEISYLYKYFKNIKPDIIHINDFAPNAMIAAHLAGIKRKIITYHTPTLNIKFNWKGRIACAWGFRGDYYIIVPTPSLKEFLILNNSSIQSSRVRVINYGLEKNNLVASVDKEQMRKSLGLSSEAFVIINVARLCRQKAQHLILRSLKLLPSELFKKTIVLIAGEGEEGRSLKNLIRELDLEQRVFLLGHRRDIADLLNISDIFVLSSLFEGACVSLMEAMALGVPIIAPNIEGIKDSVADRVTGLLIPPGDPKALARAITLLSQDRPTMRAMAIAGKSRFNQYFTKERMIKEIYNLYINSG